MTKRNPGPCTVDGCDRIERARNLCTLHYDRLRKTGRVGPAQRLRVIKYEADRACLVEGCDGKVMARGWCSSHWQRWRNHGDPLAGNRSPAVRRTVDGPDDTRQCTVCETFKPLTEFDRDKNASRGRRSQCKPCRGAKVAKWYSDNHEVEYAKRRAAVARDIEKVRLHDQQRYRRNLRKRLDLAKQHTHIRRIRLTSGEYERGITVAALRAIHGDRCRYCTEVLSFEVIVNNAYNPRRATIEHITPISGGGGHTFANTCLACWQCNVRKNNKPLSDWLGSTD